MPKFIGFTYCKKYVLETKKDMDPTEKILSWSSVQITGLANCIGLSVIYLEESVCVADGRKLKCWSDKVPELATLECSVPDIAALKAA